MKRYSNLLTLLLLTLGMQVLPAQSGSADDVKNRHSASSPVLIHPKEGDLSECFETGGIIALEIIGRFNHKHKSSVSEFEKLAQGKKLESLTIRNGIVSEKQFEALGKGATLKSLSFCAVQLPKNREITSQTVSGLKNLEELSIQDGTWYLDTGEQNTLSLLPKLKMLNLCYSGRRYNGNWFASKKQLAMACECAGLESFSTRVDLLRRHKLEADDLLALGKLTELKTLRLEADGGTKDHYLALATALSKLKNLEELVLNIRNLEGVEILKGISDVNKLRVLQIKGGGENIAKSLSGLTKLEVLSIADGFSNKPAFSSNELDFLGHCKSLRSLKLWGGKGIVPLNKVLSKNNNFESLSIGDYDAKILEWICKQSNLTELTLCPRDLLSGEIAHWFFGRLKNLESFTFWGCNFTSELSRSLAQIDTLTSLTLMSSSHKAFLPETSELAKLKNLTKFTLHGWWSNKSEWFLGLQVLPVLQNLSLFNCFEKTSPEIFGAIGKLTGLKSFSYHSNNSPYDGGSEAADAAFAKLISLNELTSLDIKLHDLTENGFKLVGKLTSLKHLSIKGLELNNAPERRNLNNSCLKHLKPLKNLLTLSASREILNSDEFDELLKTIIVEPIE